MKSTRVILSAALTLALGGACALGGSDTRDKARAVFEKNKDAVLWVTATIKIELSGAGSVLSSKETEVQALGTVIDDSGLTVVSYSALDPGAAYTGRTVKLQGENVKLSAKSEHSEVKINLADGKEIPAKIVLKDPDLDLAFVMPEKADTKLGVTPVKLGKTPAVKTLDELVCLGRMPKAMDQTPQAALSELTGVIKKPRTLLMGGRTLGGPVFTLDGQVLGITTGYKNDPTTDQMSLVILPAEDVAEVAKQALAHKDDPAASAETPKESTPSTSGQATTKPADEKSAETPKETK